VTTLPPVTLPSNINTIAGWIPGSFFDEGGPSNGDPEKCRQLAIASNGKYIAWGHRDRTHPDPSYRNTCFLYKTLNMQPGGTPLDQGYHSTGCLNPGQNASKNCISQITFGDINKPVFINTTAMHKGSGGNIGTLPFTVGNGTKVFTFTYTTATLRTDYVRTRINFYGPKPYEIYTGFIPTNGIFILTDTVDNNNLPAGTYNLNIYVDYGDDFAVEATIKNV
jgi:hypothetical protein